MPIKKDLLEVIFCGLDWSNNLINKSFTQMLISTDVITTEMDFFISEISSKNEIKE